MPPSLRSSTAMLGLAAAIWVTAGWHADAATLAPGTGGPSSWTVYHGDAAGTGVAAPMTAIDTTAPAWTSPALDGEIYGEPLVFSKRVYVATENDTVYALSSATGAIIWSVHLGTPVPAGSLPCGNITPTVGITGTPVIDPARAEIFVVADELVNGAPAHLLVGLAATSGKSELTQPVDPAGADTATLLQRTGLTLDAGQVVFGFGGNFGDCGPYRGRLVAVPETGGTPKGFTVDAAAGESQGSIWMGGAAPAVDSSGDLWVSTGNGSVHSAAHAYDDSDAVLELSSSLRLLQFFAPSTWASNNANDLDMTTEPVLLPGGQVLIAGKSRIAYLLDGAALGGIGGQQADLGPVCGVDIAGGSARLGQTVYLPCLSGIIAVRAARSPAALALLWSSGTGGGPPIVAAGLIWTIGPDGTLYGLDPATGRIRQQASIGAPANHFPTPSVGDGLLLAPSADQVVAFGAAAPGSSATATPASQPADGHSGASSAGTVAGIVVVIVLVSGAAWLIWRRRAEPRHDA